MTQLTFESATHTYRYEGVVVPSVTQIIAPLNDFSRVAPDVLEAARSFGTAVHRATELSDAGTLDPTSISTAVAPRLTAWRNFLQEYTVTTLASEVRVYHPAFRYGGTLDRYALVDGEPFILDIKTGGACPSYGPQLAAYTEAWKSGHLSQPIPRRACVYLMEDTRYKFIECPYPEFRQDFSVFLSCLTIYNFRQKHGTH